MITILEPHTLFSILFLLCSSPISKIPTKNSPKNFVICWFDDVLLILIRGFAWFQVDLAFPQVSPSFIHEISSILTPKSSNSAQNRVPDLKSRVDPDPPDDRRFTGRPDPHEAPDVRNSPDDRNHLYSRNFRISGLFRTSGIPRF